MINTQNIDKEKTTSANNGVYRLVLFLSQRVESETHEDEILLITEAC
jgi:hypothetical protein